MTDGTPTVGDLKREIEELRRENEDLHARVEELEEREGLSDDAEPEPYEDYRPYEDWEPEEAPDPTKEEEILREIHWWLERQGRRRSTGGPR